MFNKRYFYWVILVLSGCSVDSANSHYLLGEKLWTDRKYQVAVSEFEKVIVKDSQGKLGHQALFRAATTQYLFLFQYGDAIRKFRDFVQKSGDTRLVWEAQLHIGEILFSKTEQYDQAILHYQTLLKQKPNGVEAPEFLFRIAKSHFFLFQFKDAIRNYEALMSKYSTTLFAEKALFEIGMTYLTEGKEGKDDYDRAQDAFRKFIQKYPKSPLVPQAKFGIASCLEEQDQLREAYFAFKELKDLFPSPQVIQVKLSRIQQRLAQRRATR